MNINELRELVKHCVYIEKGITCMSDTYYDDMIRTINNLQSKIDKVIKYIEENIDLEMDDFTKIDIGCEILKILDLDKYNEFLKEESK